MMMRGIGWKKTRKNWVQRDLLSSRKCKRRVEIIMMMIITSSKRLLARSLARGRKSAFVQKFSYAQITIFFSVFIDIPRLLSRKRGPCIVFRTRRDRRREMQIRPLGSNTNQPEPFQKARYPDWDVFRGSFFSISFFNQRSFKVRNEGGWIPKVFIFHWKEKNLFSRSIGSLSRRRRSLFVTYYWKRPKNGHPNILKPIFLASAFVLSLCGFLRLAGRVKQPLMTMARPGTFSTTFLSVRIWKTQYSREKTTPF